MISEVYNEDCMVGMARYPDKFFDLAIVDPPYGINISHNMGRRKGYKASKYKKIEWDSSPPKPEYFYELFRVSKHQIIFGANYFPTLWLDGCKGFLFWDKQNSCPSFSDGELAFTNFDKPAKCARIAYNGGMGAKDFDNYSKIHPTQKPIKLYKWLLTEYAQISNKILDTHLGSGSSRIAAHDMGLDFYGWELDKDYFDAMQLRYKKHISQQTLFKHEMTPTKEQQLNIGMDSND